MQGRMMAGGFTKTGAKLFGNLLGADMSGKVVTNPAEFDLGVVTLWASTSEAVDDDGALEQAGLLGRVLQLQQAADATPKMEALAEATRHNPYWGGAMTTMEVDLKPVEEWGFASSPALLSNPAACPWLCRAKPFHMRFGPGQWPLPGFGVFVVAQETAACDISLVIFPAEGALQQGIMVGDIAKFINSGSGNSWVQESVRVVALKSKMVAWVPYGHIVMPFTHYDLEAKANADDKKAIATQVAPAVWCFTPFVAALVEKLPDNVWNAIRGWNDEYFGKQRSQLWTSRAAVVKEFVESLGGLLMLAESWFDVFVLLQRDCAAVQQCLRSDSHCEALSSRGEWNVLDQCACVVEET